MSGIALGVEEKPNMVPAFQLLTDKGSGEWGGVDELALWPPPQTLYLLGPPSF